MRCGKEQEEKEVGRSSRILLLLQKSGGDGQAQALAKAFEDRALSRTCPYAIVAGSGFLIFLLLVLPLSSRQSAQHASSSKQFSWTQQLLASYTSRQVHRHLSALYENFAEPSNGFPAISPSILLACNATRFPDVCQPSLTSLPSAAAATSVLSVADSAMALSRTEAMSLRHLSQKLLSMSANVNLTDAAKDCTYLLEQASAYIQKSHAIPLARKRPWQVADAQAWMSAALTYENDCWSALSYVNTSRAVDNLMQKLLFGITVTSNALCMVDAYRQFGNKTGLWVPPTRLTVYDPVVSPVGVISGGWWRDPALTVALNGSGDYSSVQAAINAAPEGLSTWYVIHVRAGVYKQTVRVPSSKNRIALIGDGMGICSPNWLLD